MKEPALLAVSIFVAAGCASLAAQPQVVNCKAATDPAVASLAAYVRELVTRTDSAYVATRQRYRLPAADSAAVQVVTDNSICNLAASAWALDEGEQEIKSVVVVRVADTLHVVEEPTARVGEWIPTKVFNSDFTAVLARVAE